MHSSGWLGYSVREFMQRAAKLILAASTTGPQMDRRIDKFHDCELWDAKRQRWHPVTVRVRVTVRSRILERSDISGVDKQRHL